MIEEERQEIMQEQLFLFPELSIKPEIINGNAIDVSTIDVFFEGDTQLHKNANITIEKLKSMPSDTVIAFKSGDDGLPYLKNVKTDVTYKARTTRSEYTALNLPFAKNYTISCHRLFAILFLKNPNTKFYTEVNHLDENKRNYKLDNLQWMTPSDHRKLTQGQTK